MTTNSIKINDLKKILEMAADALEIASDSGVSDVQIYPPPNFRLYASCGQDDNEGWCSTQSLALKLRQFEAELK